MKKKKKEKKKLNFKNRMGTAKELKIQEKSSYGLFNFYSQMIGSHQPNYSDKI